MWVCEIRFVVRLVFSGGRVMVWFCSILMVVLFCLNSIMGLKIGLVVKLRMSLCVCGCCIMVCIVKLVICVFGCSWFMWVCMVVVVFCMVGVELRLRVMLLMLDLCEICGERILSMMG